jgi:hypothetical protein
VAEEALGISLYCDFIAHLKEAVVLAMNHSGDSDSAGAIAGNICGALYGAEPFRPSRSLPWNCGMRSPQWRVNLTAFRERKLHDVAALWERYQG